MRPGGSTLLALLLTLFSIHSFAVPRRVKAVYCSQSAQGEWRLQRFRPLINPRAKTVFTQMSFAGRRLEAVRLRKFYPEYEVSFEYKYDAAGRLNALAGDIEMWGEWSAQADLFPDPDGQVGEVHVSYYKSGTRDRIARPEESQAYTELLRRVPVYGTTESLPCGDSLQEAERLNATQE